MNGFLTLHEVERSRHGYDPTAAAVEHALRWFLERYPMTPEQADELRQLTLSEAYSGPACDHLELHRVSWKGRARTLLELRTALEQNGLIGHWQAGLMRLASDRRSLTRDGYYLVLPPHVDKVLVVETGSNKGQPEAEARIEHLTTRLLARATRYYEDRQADEAGTIVWGGVYIYTLPAPSSAT